MNSRIRRLWALLAAVALSAMLVAPAMAAKPDADTIDLDDPFLEAGLAADISDACGTEMAVDAEGQLRIKVFSDRQGDFKREIDKWFIRIQVWNVATDESVLIRDVGPDIIWINKDGDLLVAITGRSLTGSGVIGRTVINISTGELVSQSGMEVGDFIDNVCAAIG
jgi:hypothetical protein